METGVPGPVGQLVQRRVTVVSSSVPESACFRQGDHAELTALGKSLTKQLVIHSYVQVHLYNYISNKTHPVSSARYSSQTCNPGVN